MILMLSYVKDTQRQIATLKYGIMFVVVATMVTSPWYLKNYLQTGNPFYPLFNSFFQSLYQQPVQEIIWHQAGEKIGQLSFFKMRQVMYGETFWETLLIPIRMFFQGEDNSYRYFQGVLNPILIVFSPFILLDRKYKRDKILFAFFSILFVFIAYFLTEKQVRYILPVLPFLSILAVMGIKDLTDKLKAETFLISLRFHITVGSISRIVLFAGVSILLASNFFYLRDRMNIIKPLSYISGQESREKFLKRHLLHYNAVQYINANLMDDARVFTMFLGRRGYYLDKAYKNEPSFGRNALENMVNRSDSEEKLKEYVRSLEATHILMRTDLVDKFLQDNFSRGEVGRFINLAKKCWKPVYEYNGYAVWDIRSGS
jgi:glycosyl transferase family 22 (putative mannosyltransferase)